MNACWSVAVQGSLKGLVCSELPAVCRGIPHKSRSPLRDYHATFEDCLPVLLLFIWRGIPAFWNDGACNVLQTDSLKQLCRPSIWMLLYEYLAFFFFFFNTALSFAKTWLSGHGDDGLMIRPGDFTGLSQSHWFCDSMNPTENKGDYIPLSIPLRRRPLSAHIALTHPITP